MIEVRDLDSSVSERRTFRGSPSTNGRGRVSPSLAPLPSALSSPYVGRANRGSRKGAVVTRTLAVAIAASFVFTLVPSGSVPVAFSAPDVTSAASQSPQVTGPTLSLVWTNVTASAGPVPQCRDSEGLAYDTALGEVVMFGGVSQCGGQPNAYSLADTWTYSGAAWTNISGSMVTVPSARWGMVMVYDPALREVVLFGGTDAFGNTNDQTWLFNGTWFDNTSNETASPPAMYGAAATYDPSLGGVLVYGGVSGFGGTTYSGTYLFKNGQWTQLSVSGPDPLRSAGLVYDNATNQSLLFGGWDSNSNAPSNDVWAFASGSWSRISVSGTLPSARYSFGEVYDPVTASILEFGGFGGAVTQYVVGDSWVYANHTWTNATSTLAGSSAAPRGGARLVWDPATDVVLLFGGQANSVRNNDTWLAVPLSPPALSVTPAAIAPGQRVDVNATVTGGEFPLTYSYSGLPSGCVSVNATNLSCSPSGTGEYTVSVRVHDPTGSNGTASASLTIGSPVAITSFTAVPSNLPVGSTSDLNVTATGGSAPYTYSYTGLPPNCASENTSRLTCASEYAGSFNVVAHVVDADHATAPTTSVMVTYVSQGPSGTFGWTNISSFEKKTPACRDSEGLVYDPALGTTVMFGGVSQCGQVNSYSDGDTWTFSSGQWTNISSSVATAPSARWGMVMVYDPAESEVVLFGGSDVYGNVNTQTWTFDGTWTNVTGSQTVSPPALYSAGATYDPVLGGVLIYGGQAGFNGPTVTYNQTWLFKAGQWSQLNVFGPDPLRSPSLVYDTAISADLLFGGADGTTGTDTDSTWVFADGAWTFLSPSFAPSARYDAGVAYRSHLRVGRPVRGVCSIGGCARGHVGLRQWHLGRPHERSAHRSLRPGSRAAGLGQCREFRDFARRSTERLPGTRTRGSSRPLRSSALP